MVKRRVPARTDRRMTWVPPRLTAVLLALAAIVATAGEGHAPARASEATPQGVVRPLSGIHNDNGRLVDSSGRTVVLRGINVVDKSGWTGALAAPILTAADAQNIADLGFNHVRLGLTWASVEHTRGVFDDSYLRQLLGVLDALYAVGLVAVIDMHQDVWSAGLGSDGAPAWADPQCNQTVNPGLDEITGQWVAQYGSPEVNVAWANFWNDGYGSADLHCTGPIQTAFARMWRHVAGRLGGHPAVIGYDILNEPWPSAPPGAFEQLQLMPMYTRVAAAIREVDPHTSIFFGPPIYSPAAPTFALTPPDPNSVFAPHIYTETMFSGGNVSTDARSDELALIKDLEDGTRIGVPVWVGEWGAVNDHDYIAAFYDLLDRHQASAAFWLYAQMPGENQVTGHEAPHTRMYPEAYPGAAEWHYSADLRRLSLTVAVPAGRHEVRVVVPAAIGITQIPPGATYDQTAQRLSWCVEGPSTHILELGPSSSSSTSECTLTASPAEPAQPSLGENTENTPEGDGLPTLPATGHEAAGPEVALVALMAALILRGATHTARRTSGTRSPASDAGGPAPG